MGLFMKLLLRRYLDYDNVDLLRLLKGEDNLLLLIRLDLREQVDIADLACERRATHRADVRSRQDVGTT